MARIQTVFNSYEEALSASASGYDSDDIARVVTLKTEAIAPELRKIAVNPDPNAIITAISCLSTAQTRGRTCRIVDIGGASGYHYLCVREALGDAPYQWTVVETPAMVRAATPLFADSRLRFVSELDEALESGADLVVCSGALQYMPQPEAVLERILTARPRHIVLARLPVYEGPRVVGIEDSALRLSGPGPMPAGIQDRAIRYPITFLPMSVLAPYLTEYRTMQRYLSPSANYIIGETNIPGMSFVLERMQ